MDMFDIDEYDSIDTTDTLDESIPPPFPVTMPDNDSYSNSMSLQPIPEESRSPSFMQSPPIQSMQSMPPMQQYNYAWTPSPHPYIPMMAATTPIHTPIPGMVDSYVDQLKNNLGTKSDEQIWTKEDEATYTSNEELMKISVMYQKKKKENDASSNNRNIRNNGNGNSIHTVDLNDDDDDNDVITIDIDGDQDDEHNKNVDNENDDNEEKKEIEKCSCGEVHGKLTEYGLRILQSWFQCNVHYPYPSDYDLQILSQQTQLAIHQINEWFFHTRQSFNNLVMKQQYMAQQQSMRMHQHYPMQNNMYNQQLQSSSSFQAAMKNVSDLYQVPSELKPRSRNKCTIEIN